MIREFWNKVPRTYRPLLVAGGIGLVAWALDRFVFNRESPDIWLENPGRGDIDRAREFRKKFHWGYPAKSVSRRSVSKPPRTAVKLGKLEGVIYRTNKKGDGPSSYVHDFEGTKPDLLMDIDNRKLHIAGGSYNVEADGITG